jgi:hypothetical protein
MEEQFGGYRQAPSAAQSEWSERLALELDPRLAEVWSCIFQYGLQAEETLEQLGWFLRMAYLNGYQDGLIEPDRGELLRALGLQVPGRSNSRYERRG